MNQPAITTQIRPAGPPQAIDQLEEADQEAMAAEREVAAGVLLVLGVPSWEDSSGGDFDGIFDGFWWV